MLCRIPVGHSCIMAGGNERSIMLFGPVKQSAELEVAIARDAGIRRAAVKIILRKRLHHRLGKLLAQVEQRVRNPEMLGDLFRAAMIRAHTVTPLSFPHAERYAMHVKALLDE